MKRKLPIILCTVLIAALAFTIAACSNSGLKHSDIKSIDVESDLRKEDFLGFPLQSFDISQITLVVELKDTVDESGNTVAGEIKRIEAKDYMLKAADREKLKTSGRKDITLVCYGFEITFPLTLYDEIKEKYTVAFYDEDGTTKLGATHRVQEGGRAEPPEVSAKEGYTFVGWIDIDTGKSATFDNIRKNTRLRAYYEKNTIEIRYLYNDGTKDVVIEEKSLPSSERGEDYYPEPPIRQGFEFTGWTKRDDNTFYAEYSPVKYSVRFVYRPYTEGRYDSTGEYDFGGRYSDTLVTKSVSITDDNKEINAPTDYLPTDANSKGKSDADDYRFVYWYVLHGDRKVPVSFPMTAKNAYETTYYAYYIDMNVGSEGLKYKRTGDTCIVDRYDGDGGIVVIPEKTVVDGKVCTVSGISDGVFKSASVTEFVVSGKNGYFATEDGVLYNTDYTILYAYPAGSEEKETTIKADVEEISSYAFHGAKNLVKINFNEKLKSIKDYAFRNCVSLESVEIPASVVSISEGAFKTDGNSALKTFTFAGTEVVSLGDEALYGLNSLEELVLPASLSSIGDGTFYGCSSLKRVDATRNSYFTEYNGALYSVDFRTLYAYPALYTENANPEVSLHENCKTISRGAFYYANVVCITFNSDVEPGTYSIVCPSLKSVRINYSGYKFVKETFMQAFAEYAPDILYVKNGNRSFENVTLSDTEIRFYDEWIGYNDYYNGFAYTLNDDQSGVIINGYNGKETALTIPSMIDDLPVVEIADNAFNGNATIETVEIPVEVKKIGKTAFASCVRLKSVALAAGEGSTLSISDRAFNGCSSLETFDVSDGVIISDFGKYVFDGTPIFENGDEFTVIGGVLVDYKGHDLSVTVPANTEYIATDAFKDCGFITSISFETGSKLRVIDEYAFLNCSGIKQIVIPSSIEEVKNNAFYGCDYLYSVKYLAAKAIVTIGNDAYYQAGGFYGEGVYEEFSDTVKGKILYYVGNSNTEAEGIAFVEPIVPELGSTELFVGWFYDSDFTRRVKFPINVESDGQISLYACIKDSSYVSDGLVYSRNEDGTYTVTGYVGSDDYVVIGKTYMGAVVRGISENAFGEKVVELRIPNELDSSTSEYVSDIVTIGLDAFVKTQWYKNMAGDFVIYDNLLIAYKGESKIAIVPDKVTVLAAGVFKDNKNLEYVKLPDGVSIIPENAFNGCTALKTIVLGNQTSEIKSKAFYGCKSLSEINFDSTPGLGIIAPDALDGSAWIYENAEDCIIINDILYKYNGAEETLHIPAGVTGIAENAFRDNSTLVNVYLPTTLTIIRSYAFGGAISLNAVYIPTESPMLAYIMNNAFADCYNLKTVNLENATTLSEIGDSAFENCSSYKSLIIPADLIFFGEGAFRNSGVETVAVRAESRLGEIGDYAFDNCRRLKSVKFEGESALNRIGKGTFRNCSALEEFYNPLATISVFDDYSLYNCQSLSKVTINEDNVTVIGKEAVYRLGYISAQNKNMIILGNILISYSGTEKVIDIPDNITLIYDSAFEGNTNVLQIKFGEGSMLKKINDKAFYGCTNLAEINFPEKLDTVGYKVIEGTLWYSEKLNSEDYVTINNTLIKYNVSYTKQAEVPDYVTRIIRGAFEGASVYDIKIGPNVTEIADGAFDGIIPTEWVENTEVRSGWTLTVENDAPAQLDCSYEFENCVAIYVPDEESLERFILSDEWAEQRSLLKVIEKFAITYKINKEEAVAIDSESVHALYGAKEVVTYSTAKKQYVFVGWFLDEKYEKAVTYPFILTEDTKVYAKCVDYDIGSNPDKYALEDDEDYPESYTIKRYLDTTDKKVVIITEQAGRSIYSITGYFGYVPYDRSGTEYVRYVFNSENNVFEEYNPYETYPEGTEVYRRNTVIEEIDFANNCTIEVLGANCFAGLTGLTKIKLPSSVKRIESDAFADCVNLREVEFADGIENLTIESGAFRNCSSLQSIKLPSGVTTLEDKAFEECYVLREVYLLSETPITLYQDAQPFEFNNGLRIYVPYGKKSAYGSAWKDYADYIVESAKESNLSEEE